MDKTTLSLQSALEIIRGRNGGSKRWPAPTPDQLKDLRQRLQLSQSEFARLYGIEPTTLKHWESSRRKPEQVSCLFLRMIQVEPETVARLVQRVEKETKQKEMELEDA